MILIWRFGKCIEIAKLTYAIIDPFILQAWVFLHTVLKSANFKSHQQQFEQTTKYNVHQYFCLYGILCATHKKTDSHAAHKVLLTHFLQSCSPRRWILCSAQNRARVLHTKANSCVTRKFGLSHSTKNTRTHVFCRT